MVVMSLGEYEMARLGFLEQGRRKEPEAAAESNTGGSVRWVSKDVGIVVEVGTRLWKAMEVVKRGSPTCRLKDS
jgi:hypothetical protein